MAPCNILAWPKPHSFKPDRSILVARHLVALEYVHRPELAPTAEILDPYKEVKNGDWTLYERQFLELMRARQIEITTPNEILNGACLLCSEEKPHHCHRRLVAEYLQPHWNNVQIEHIP